MQPTLATFAQTAPQASPTPIKADKPAAKEFKAELTPEESALLRPVIDEFNKWSAKLAAASDMLDKSDAAASPDLRAREAILREQMATIQRQLGEGDGKAQRGIEILRQRPAHAGPVQAHDQGIDTRFEVVDLGRQ